MKNFKYNILISGSLLTCTTYDVVYAEPETSPAAIQVFLNPTPQVDPAPQQPENSPPQSVDQSTSPQNNSIDNPTSFASPASQNSSPSNNDVSGTQNSVMGEMNSVNLNDLSSDSSSIHPGNQNTDRVSSVPKSDNAAQPTLSNNNPIHRNN